MLLVMGNRNYSSWSLRAWLALRHTGAAFDEVVVPLWQASTREEIRRHSPSGRVPVLEVDGQSIWDSLAICEWAAERFPEAKLWPADPSERALARSVTCEMHAGFTALRTELPMNIRLRRQKALSPDAERDVARVEAMWADLRNRHGGRGPFLFGDFTIADAFYAPVVLRFVTWGVKLSGAAAAYAENVLGLPAMGEWIDLARKEPWTDPQSE